PCSTTISVRSVAFRISASLRTSRVSIPLDAPFGAGTVESAMDEKTLLLRFGVGRGEKARGGLQGEFVASGAETGDHPGRGQGDIGRTAEILPRGGVGQMA